MRDMLIRAIRSSRAVMHPRLNTAIGSLHHLSEKHYLRRELTTAQRVRFALDHKTHNTITVDRVELWRRGNAFIVIHQSDHVVREGDLTVALHVADKPLHKMTLSLIHTGIPFVGRSQGCANYHPEAREEFNEQFPQNSAARFVFAAVSGIARAVGSDRVIGVRAAEQVCVPHGHYDEWLRYHRDYDELWESLGGKDFGGLGYVIPLLDYDKPVEASSASHRRRARKRRQHWLEIERDTIDAMPT